MKITNTQYLSELPTHNMNVGLETAVNNYGSKSLVPVDNGAKKILTKMKNRVTEINDEPVGERLSKDQYSSLMQIRTYAKELKMQMKLASLESQICDLQKANLKPAELVLKITDIESEIESILSTARSSTVNDIRQTKSEKPKSSYKNFKVAQ